jgi:hypothetical protein
MRLREIVHLVALVVLDGHLVVVISGKPTATFRGRDKSADQDSALSVIVFFCLERTKKCRLKTFDWRFDFLHPFDRDF